MKKWQTINLDFFISEVLTRLRDGRYDKNMVLEFQNFEALRAGKPNNRIFFGYYIRPWCYYMSETSRNIRRNYINTNGLEWFRKYEKDYAFGVALTGENGTIDVAPFSKFNNESFNILLASSFDYGMGSSKFNVPMWYENENGEKMVRVRIWNYAEFKKMALYFQRHWKFKESVIKDDII